VLNKDMATASEYLQLKLNTTLPLVFHGNNKEAERKLKVNHNNKTLFFCFDPKYLGVTLDWSLTYRRYLESLHKS